MVVPGLLAALEGGPVNIVYGTVLLMLLGPRAERENSRLDDDQHPHKETSVVLLSLILRHHEKHRRTCVAKCLEAVVVCSASLLSHQKDFMSMRIAEQLEAPVLIPFVFDDTNLKDKLIEHKLPARTDHTFRKEGDLHSPAARR